jgi:hypothetical protein
VNGVARGFGLGSLAYMRTVILLSSVLLAWGCKDKPKNQPSAHPGSGSAQVGSQAGTGSGSGPQPNELGLPKLSGTPPAKTTKKIEKPQMEAMSKLEVDGWIKDVRRLEERGVEVRYLTQERPKLAVTVTATPCFDCIDMVLDKWKAAEDGLKLLLAPELRGHKDTSFELGATELAGAPLIFTYQVGFMSGEDESGQQLTAYSNAYALYYNDKVNSIRVVAEYKDDQPASKEDMLGLSPRADLEKIAKAYLDAYTHAWQ